MRASDLLLRLQSEAQSLDYMFVTDRLNAARENSSIKPSMMNKLLLQNYECLIELMNTTSINDDVINESQVMNMETELREYLDANMEGNDEYKIIIRIVSLYLTFILNKPLHPPGIFSKDGDFEIVNGMVVCPIRASEILKPGSLCRYCRSITKKE